MTLCVYLRELRNKQVGFVMEAIRLYVVKWIQLPELLIKIS